MNNKLSVKFVTDRQTDRQSNNSVIFLLQKYILHYLVNSILILRSIKMKLKIFIIVICLLIFGCKNKEEPIYITRIGELTPGNGGIPHLEVYNGKGKGYTIYYLFFYEVHEKYEGWGSGNYDTHPFGETVKVIGIEERDWFDLGGGNKRLELKIYVKSMEIIQPEE